MRGRLIGAYALLSAGFLQAEPITDQYSRAGDWEIISANHGACMMKRSYVLKDNGDEQTLAIYYDAQRQAALLGWGTRKPELPPLSNSLDFGLSFSGKDSSLNETWGSQTFQIDKVGDEYRFSHVFKGLADSDRFLRDLAFSGIIALRFGPTLMMARFLNASNAVASKIVGQDNSGGLRK